MPKISLPDGSIREFNKSLTVAEVAADIGAGLAKVAIAGVVNGKLVDVSYSMAEENVDLKIITAKQEEGLEILRHSCAHLLAQAVQRLYPKAQVTIGPVIDNGFYYDFAYEAGFSSEDLTAIEAEMAKIVKEDLPVNRSLMSRDEAVKLFSDKGEEYKVEIIKDIPGDEQLSFYQQGEFIDLCRGPHIPRTGLSGAFKLTKVAGAYWRGDARNPMLQRIYGTAWPTKKELKDYLFKLEEAEKRDHRKLGKKYNLFHFQEESPGMIFWHPNGWAIYQIIQEYIRNKLTVNGYQEVRTPQIVDRTLWEKSGHWDKFQENMFTLTSDDKLYAVKPMNCPCHILIYNQGIKSYRDLPFRMAEFGSCHRNEPSGTLHGLMRVRNFIQDDAHIFCTESQVQSEVAKFIDLLFEVYQDFGFDEVIIRLSTRPQSRVGTDEIWDKAETALQQALEVAGLSYELCPGEGAFYGPKIEFSLRDCIDRVWQCGTIQVDFSMPDRLDAIYIDENSGRRVPVMLHRAILGSIERFIGILIEDSAGSLPVWLSPTQVVVLNISEKHADYASSVAEELKKLSIRAGLDLRNEKIGFKIREHTIQRVPYLLVIGDKEVEQQTVSARTRDGVNLGSLSLNDFISKLRGDIEQLGRKKLLAQEKKAEIV